MTGAATATVETLTAEVRVLMVGSRQVTLSVYRQLDWLEASAIVAFGRVSTGRKRDEDEVPGGIELVGVDDDGNLVRSGSWPPDQFERAPLVFDHWCYHRETEVTYSNPCIVAEEGRHKLYWRHRSDDMRMPVPCPLISQHRPECHCRDYRSSENMKFSKWLCAERYHQSRVGAFCDMDKLELSWRNKADDEFRELVKARCLHDKMAALPLIVLAGLR